MTWGCAKRVCNSSTSVHRQASDLGLRAKLGPLSAMTGHFIWYFWLLSDQLLRAKSALGHRPLTKALPILGSR